MRCNEHLCRTCLAINKQTISLNTYLAGAPSITLADALQSCMQQELRAAHWPARICLGCSVSLQHVHKFIRQARESENILLNMQQERDSPSPHTDSPPVQAQSQSVNASNTGSIQFSDQFGRFLESYNGKANGEKHINELTQPKTLSRKDGENNNDEKIETNEVRQTLVNAVDQNFDNETPSISNTNTPKKPNFLLCDEGKKAFSCVRCKESFPELAAYAKHNHSRHNAITPLRCVICTYSTCYAESLRKHYWKQHQIKATDSMLDNFADLSLVVPTARQAPKEFSFHCHICLFVAHAEADIRAHVVGEHRGAGNVNELFTKVYHCGACHRTFKDQKCLSTHFTAMHGPQTGRKQPHGLFACDKCRREFSNRASLVLHKRVCRWREAVSCNSCTKKFGTMRSFELHLRTEHNVQTIYECEVCEKQFSTPESLRMHRRRHTERHYQCDQCPRNYINATELRVHIDRMHGTELKARCRTCGMSFTQKGLLRQHESKAHFKKYFKCLYCDYQSTLRCNVRSHQYQHTGKPYKCDICRKEFVLRSTIRRHAQVLHGVQLTDERLAAMFREKFGYPSRYDAFSKANNSLEITDFNEEDIALELKEFGLDVEDIAKDLFATGTSVS